MLYGTTLCFDAARHTFFLLIMSSLCTPMYSCILFYSSRLALLRADVFRFSLGSFDCVSIVCVFCVNIWFRVDGIKNMFTKMVLDSKHV